MCLNAARHSLVLSLVLLASACGGGGNGPAPNPDAGGPGGQIIRGGERLGWNQQAASAADLRSYTFTLYIDGGRSSLGDVRCGDAAGPAGFDCSGRLPTMSPGTHTLQVTASVRGIESPRSPSLTVTFMPGQSTDMTTERLSGDIANRDGASGGELCFGARSRDCYRAESIADGLGEVSAFARLWGDALLFVENGRRVRLLADGVLLGAPLLSLEENVTIAAIVAHPGYARNGFVYIAEVQTLGPAEHAVRVVRYRALERQLGEAATIVPDMPVAAPQVQIAFGPDRRLYVAMPGVDAPLDGPRSAYDGFILRFDEEGGVPREARASSPIYSRGYALPAALAAGNGSELWLAGTGGGLAAPLARVDLLRQTTWPAMPRPLSSASESSPFGVSSPSAFWSDGRTEGIVFFYVSPDDGALVRMTIPRGARTGTPSRTQPVLDLRTTSAIGASADGSIYVAVKAPPAASGTRILRLVPGR